MSQRHTIADHLEAADLSPPRFIDVVDGEKKSVDHEQHGPDGVEGNYGVYANGDDRLVILDIDDYEDLDDKSGFSALSRLPATLEQGSPHGGTHRFYAVQATDDGRLVAAALADEFGSANLKASWGEIRTSNQYVVGAGSQLDGCGKDWCSDCADPDGGHYVLKSDTEIATIDAEDLIDVLSADPELSRTPARTSPPGETGEKARSTDVDVDVFDVISRAYSTGERHAHPIHGSDTGANFMVDEGAETWRCWRDSCTGNALHLVGMEEGIIDCGEWQGTGLSKETWAEIFDAARDRGLDVGPPPEDTEFDSTSDFDETEVERGVAILESQTSPKDPVGELTHHNGGYGIYWFYTDDKGNVTDSGVDQVCNFELETLSLLSIENQDHDEFKIRVHPNHPTEEPYDVRIAPTVFNSADSFRSQVVTGRTTWFDPSNREGVPTDTILRDLRETVGAQPAPHRTGQPYVGLSDDGTEFVTPAGSLTAEGWSDDPRYEFYSIGGDNSDIGPFGQKWELSPDHEIDVDPDEVARICELLPNTRKTERGIPIYAWFYTAPLKPHIHDWEREFPLLAPHGDTETGKTSTLEAFIQAFGGDGEPVSSTDTKFTKEKHLAESRGFPVFIDEYKPTEIPGAYLDHLHQRLKEVTKERTMPKGRPDLGMDQLHMRAPVIVSGEQKINDPAVRRRSILTNLSSQPTQDGTATKAAFGELTGIAYENADGEQQYPDGCDLHQHARAYYEWVLGLETAEIRDAWEAAREREKDILDDLGVTLSPSEERALQTIVFGVDIARQFAEAFDADVSQLPTEADVLAACNHVVQNIGKGGQRREHADEFLEVLSLAATNEYLEPGVHHRIMESSSAGTEILAVHMPSTFGAVKRFVRESNLEDEYTLLSKTDYLNSFGNKASIDGSYVVDTNKRTRGIENGGRAVHFDHEKIREKLGADFNIDAFRPPEERGADEPVTAIGDLSSDGNPYTSISVVVSSWQEGPENGPAYSGVVRDRTGLIDIVDWEGTLSLDEESAYRLDDVRVGTHDGAVQVEVVPDVTEATEIDRGDGYTNPPDEGGDSGAQSALDHHDAGADEAQAAADGGEASQRDIARAVIQQATAKQGDGPGAAVDDVVETVTSDLGVSPDRVRHRIDKMKNSAEARLWSPEHGYLRTD